MSVFNSATIQDYYQTRPLSEPANYESYWTQCIDPDGNVRDRMSDKERETYLANIRRELDFVCGLRPAVRTLLDVGCGPGWFLSAISDSVGQRVGVEKSSVAAQEAERLNPGVYIYPGELDDMEFGAEAKASYFDVIFCHHVIEHIEQPELLLAEMHRVLMPGGHLIIATPDFGSPCAKRFGNNYRMLHDRTHVSLFTNESMHRFLRDYGFEIDEVDYPFPEQYVTAETMDRWNDTSKASPPWPGNWMTFYCRKNGGDDHCMKE